MPAFSKGLSGARSTILYAKLSASPDGGEVPSQLHAAQAPWFATRDGERVRVGAIRRRLISDVALASVEDELQGIDIVAVELLEIDVAHCVQRGDLHCANVIFDERGFPTFIDYPEIGRTLASLDPIAHD